MKLVLFLKDGQPPHRKNYQALSRMCQSCSIEYEETTDYDRLKRADYDMLMSTTSYVCPEDIPSSIKIIQGPHFFVFPNDVLIGEENPAYDNRCVYNCLSEWNRNAFYECSSSYRMKLVTFPFSVNTDYFKPYDQCYDPIFDCILYIKHRSKALENQAIKLLEAKNLRYHVFRYGSYKEEDYMYGIRMSKFMIVLDGHESQGFALEEAMSCNVPLLVVDASSMYDETDDSGTTFIYEHLKPKKLLATSVPYWSEECGIKISNPSNLSDAIDVMMRIYKSFTPRKYILRTLSDKVCMERMLHYFNLNITL